MIAKLHLQTVLLLSRRLTSLSSRSKLLSNQKLTVKESAQDLNKGLTYFCLFWRLLRCLSLVTKLLSQLDLNLETFRLCAIVSATQLLDWQQSIVSDDKWQPIKLGVKLVEITSNTLLKVGNCPKGPVWFSSVGNSCKLAHLVSLRYSGVTNPSTPTWFFTPWLFKPRRIYLKPSSRVPKSQPVIRITTIIWRQMFGTPAD